jgi:hypothetical protein
MDYNAWKVWIDLAQLILWALLGIYTWFSNRHRVTNKRIESLETSVDERIDGQSERIIRIEERLSHLPGQADLGELHEKVNELSTSTGEVRGEIRAIHRTVSMINEHLMRANK